MSLQIAKEAVAQYDAACEKLVDVAVQLSPTTPQVKNALHAGTFPQLLHVVRRLFANDDTDAEKNHCTTLVVYSGPTKEHFVAFHHEIGSLLQLLLAEKKLFDKSPPPSRMLMFWG